MAIPVRPSISVAQWATGNYPAGASPWSGLAKRALPPFDGFTPGTTFPFEYANYLWGTATDKLAELDANSKAMFDARLDNAMANWSADKAVNAAVATTAMVWNDLTGSWYAASGGTIWASKDAGQNWTSSTTYSGNIVSIGVNPVNGNMCAVQGTGSGTNYNKVFTASTSTWANGANLVATSADTDLVYLSSGRATAYMSGAGAFYTNNDGTTFTPGTGTLPLASASVQWKLASSGTLVVAAPMSPTTTRQYATTTDGAAWTTRTFPTGTGNCTGLDWDTFRSRWVATMAPSSGTGFTILTSTDGINWTTLTTLSGVNASDIRAGGANMGGVLMVAASTGSNLPRPIYSLDNGASFLMAETQLTASGSSPNAGARGPRFFLGAGRFAGLAGGTVRYSHAIAGNATYSTAF